MNFPILTRIAGCIRYEGDDESGVRIRRQCGARKRLARMIYGEPYRADTQFASEGEKLRYIAVTLKRIIKCCLLEATAFGILYLLCCALKATPSLDAVGMSGVLLLYVLHGYVQFLMFKLGIAMGKELKIWGLVCLTLTCMPAVNYILVAIVAIQARKMVEQDGDHAYLPGAIDAEFTATGP